MPMCDLRVPIRNMACVNINKQTKISSKKGHAVFALKNFKVQESRRRYGLITESNRI